MEEQAKRVEQLVERIYQTEGDPRLREEANKILADFATTPEAWPISRILLFNSHSSGVQFFAANTVRTKIAIDWPKLNGDEKAAVRNLVLQLIQQYLNRTDAPPMIINRLCLALAGIGLRGLGDGFWPNVVEDVTVSLQSIDKSGIIAMEVLTQLPEELHSAVLSQPRREETEKRLREEAEKVITMVQGILQTFMQDRQQHQLVSKALQCAFSWMKTGIHPSVILNKPIFGIIFNLLGDENLFKASIEIITELFTDPELDEKSVIAAIQSVLMLRDLYNAAANGEKEEICAGVCKLAAGIGAAFTDRVIKLSEDSTTEQQRAAYLAFLFECTKHPSEAVWTETIFFWSELACELWPLSATTKQGYLSTYVTLMELVMRRCRYPSDSSEDGEDLEELRKSCERLFEACYRLLESQFYIYCLELLKNAAEKNEPWQSFESVLFVVKATSYTMTHMVSASTQSWPYVKNIFVLCLQLLQQTNANKQLTETILSNFGEYAECLKGEPELLQAVVRSILMVLSSSASTSANAAISLFYVSNYCSEHLTSLMGEILTVWVNKEAMPYLPNAERNSMQDALIAIACKMPQAQHLKAAVVAIAQPIVKRLYQIAHMQQNVEKELVVGELELVSQFYLTLGQTCGKLQIDTSSHPIPDTLNEFWPCFEPLLKTWAADESVTQVICDCLDAILSSAELLFAPKLESLVVLVLNCFMTTHHSCCLRIVASIMAIFGGNKNCEGVFTNLIPQLSDTTLNYLMTKRDELDKQGGVIAAYFEVMNQASVCLPGVVFSQACLPPAFSLALIALQLPDKECRRSVITFLSEAAVHNNDVSKPLFATSGNQLMSALMTMLMDSHQQNIVYYQADLLWLLVKGVYASNQDMQVWLSNSILSMNSPYLQEEDKKRFARLIWGLNNRRAFKVMIADVAHILTGLMSAETLAGYEVND